MENSHNPKPYILTIFVLMCVYLMLITSCSCNYHIKRLNKKCANWKQDTLIVNDTVYIPSVQRDTVFKYFVRDTVVIRKENLTMKYYFNQHDSTVFLSGKCDSIVKYRFIKVPYQKAEVTFDVWREIKNNLIWIIILLILVFVVRFVWKLYF